MISPAGKRILIGKRKIAIIGAGYAGKELCQEIQKKEFPGDVQVIIDDDTGKIGSTYNGVPIEGPLNKVDEFIREFTCDEAIIAIPSAETSVIKSIYENLKNCGIPTIRIVPAISQILAGNAHLIQTREIAVHDLLGRKPVAISLKESLTYLRNKRVLITGAGGSIGSELTRQLLHGGASRLYLFDHGENNVYEIDKELHLLQEEGIGEKATIIPIIGELKDKDYLSFLFKRLNADIVFHCAAYKHVPMLENNPVEAIKNNVFGTQNLLKCAAETGVKRFVLISTDKAVQPSSTYGVSKQLCEDLVFADENKKMESIVVRFGNVLESRGSIVPLFKAQIEKGGPVTITDPDASRFFMTIPEASSLVLQAGGVGLSGKLYILDMGDPVNIQNLAEQMIKFYGYKPNKDIMISYIGLRPGEKTHERLWESSQTITATDYDKILCVDNIHLDRKKLKDTLNLLQPICFRSEKNTEKYRNRLLLRKILSQYSPNLEVPENEREY